MSLTLEQVQHIAELARLNLSPQEQRRYQEQLSTIIDFFDQIQAVDTSDIPPTSGVQPRRGRLRPDESRDSLALRDLLDNAPVVEEGQFKIPPVFDNKE